MDSQELIAKTREYVEEKLGGESSGHDWWHVYRVWQLTKRLAEEEGADQLVVELAALLHDIADWKFNDGDEQAGARVSREWLKSLGTDPAVSDQVTEIIASSSFKGAAAPDQMSSLEGKILQDADRLDTIGAIGIARTFAYGGYKNREMHNPDIPYEADQDAEAYKSGAGPTINHFYEKLLLLKDRMHTDTARRLADERHRFMEEYLERFYKEWEGEL